MRVLETVVVAVLVAGLSGAQEKPAAPNEPEERGAAREAIAAFAVFAERDFERARCPVCEGKIDETQRLTFRGKPVFFCKAECKAAFRDKPFDHVEKLRKQWDALKPIRAQVACPVTGKQFDKDHKLAFPRFDLYFASAAAKEQFEKHPERYVDKLAAAFSFQTTCATCATPIKPQVQREYEGVTYYFCCPGCMGAFERRPTGFVQSVREEVVANKAAAQPAGAKESETQSNSEPTGE